MINPQALDLNSLPSLPLAKKAELPEIPGIYFAIDSLGNIQYIGRSKNIRNRWIHHHKYTNIYKFEAVQIAYLSVGTAEVLPEIETALIDYFKPPLNTFRPYKKPIIKRKQVAYHLKTMICKLKEYMAQREINIAQLAREIDVTENAIRGYVKNSFSRIDCQVAIKICAFFNVNVGEMFEIVGDDSND